MLLNHELYSLSSRLILSRVDVPGFICFVLVCHADEVVRLSLSAVAATLFQVRPKQNE
jgi:hypothetical protein